jgi:hypothetical protein
MNTESHVLVVANVTATSRELIDTLRERATRGPCRFSLIVPTKHAVDSGHGRAEERLAEALDRMRGEGLVVEGGRVSESDPVSAVAQAGDVSSFDEIVVSTLPPGHSKWLDSDVPARLREHTGLPLQHVVATGSDWETFTTRS